MQALPAYLLLSDALIRTDDEEVGSLTAGAMIYSIYASSLQQGDPRALAITDRAYIIYEGEILREGTAPELVEDEVVRKIYLGEGFRM